MVTVSWKYVSATLRCCSNAQGPNGCSLGACRVDHQSQTSYGKVFIELNRLIFSHKISAYQQQCKVSIVDIHNFNICCECDFLSPTYCTDIALNDE